MAGTEKPPPQRAFEILSDETRVAILRALANQHRESAEESTIGFADLRRRVGMRDSGNFNYHLEKLEGRFVTKTPDGYRLAPAGFNVVAALITGVYGGAAQLGPIELADPCPMCSEPFTATYEDGFLLVECSNDHVFRNVLPPGIIDDRPLAEVIELWTLKTRHDLKLAIEQICPFCYAQLEWTVDPDQYIEPPEVETQCSRCGVRIEIPFIVSACRHPVVAAFYYEHGIDIRFRPLWAPAFYEGVDVRLTADPTRIHVDIELDGKALKTVLDESLSVVTVSEGV